MLWDTLLSSLRETDKRQVKELKGEAFDQLRAVKKVELETKVLLECVEAAIPQDLDTMQEAVIEVNRKVEELQLDDFSR